MRECLPKTLAKWGAAAAEKDAKKEGQAAAALPADEPCVSFLSQVLESVGSDFEQLCVEKQATGQKTSTKHPVQDIFGCKLEEDVEGAEQPRQQTLPMLTLPASVEPGMFSVSVEELVRRRGVVRHLPPVLLLHLDRGEGQEGAKVAFPERLSLFGGEREHCLAEMWVFGWGCVLAFFGTGERTVQI